MTFKQIAIGSWKRYWKHFEPAFVLTALALLMSAVVGKDSELAEVVFKFLAGLEDLGSLENLFHLVLLLINTNLLLAAITLPRWQESISIVHRALARYALWAYDLMSQGMAMAAGSLVAAYPFFPLLHDQHSPISGTLTLALIGFSILYQVARELPEWSLLNARVQHRKYLFLWIVLIVFSSIDLYLWLRP
jgi:hypothetical protein